MKLPALPLFHRIAGHPVIVLGAGEAAMAKRRLVERAGGIVYDDLAQGLDAGARLAFVAHDDPQACAGDAARARTGGALVNVVDQPAQCDFTTPSLIDRNPVLIAVGTGGASAGLAKHVRLRLERVLPQGLGTLARALFAARGALRARWPDAAERRRALDHALGEGGALDPMVAHDDEAVARWLEGGARDGEAGFHTITLRSEDPEDLTLREARLLGMADVLVAGADVPPAILARARADARRVRENEEGLEGLVVALVRPEGG